MMCNYWHDVSKVIAAIVVFGLVNVVTHLIFLLRSFSWATFHYSSHGRDFALVVLLFF